jgi:hypothetical protein
LTIHRVTRDEIEARKRRAAGLLFLKRRCFAWLDGPARERSARDAALVFAVAYGALSS